MSGHTASQARVAGTSRELEQDIAWQGHRLETGHVIRVRFQEASLDPASEIVVLIWSNLHLFPVVGSPKPGGIASQAVQVGVSECRHASFQGGKGFRIKSQHVPETFNLARLPLCRLQTPKMYTLVIPVREFLNPVPIKSILRIPRIPVYA